MTQELRKQPSVAPLLFSALRPQSSRRPASAGPPIGDLRLKKHTQDSAKMRKYQEICGFDSSEFVPATWLHVQTFPLHAGIMSGSDWPFPALGTVHTINEMRQFRPVSVHEQLDIHVRASNLNPHKKGAALDLIGLIRVGKEPVWAGRSTYLVTGYDLPGEPPKSKREELPEAEPSETWELPADLGRSYARVSNDYNPIHLNSVTSKLFGFKRPIVHGMWTHARALAALGDSLPEAYSVRTQFTKPVSLPAKVSFTRDENRFGVLGEDGKPRLVGSFSELDDLEMGAPL